MRALYPRIVRALDVAARWGAALAPVAVSAVACMLWYGSDRWWPATVLLYGPRWFMATPLVVLAVVAAWRKRVLLVPVGLAFVVCLGPIMGFRTGWRSLGTNGYSPQDLTVVTYNVRGGRTLRYDVARLMNEWNADVAAFQECGALRWEILTLEGWHTRARSRACLVSRFPILDARVMPREDLEAAGGSGLAVGYLLDGDQGPFWITNVHLATPRAGLELIRSGRILTGAELTRQQSLLRADELASAARFASETPGPSIVAGDFNTPVESTIYRRAWGSWTNAFSVAGFGLGMTRRDGWAQARIDHLLVDDGWVVVSARLGADMGSDHLPLIARIRRS